MPLATEDEMLTLDEASERFGISVSTLRFWRDRKELSRYKRGRVVVVDAAEVRRKVDERRQVRREE